MKESINRGGCCCIVVFVVVVVSVLGWFGFLILLFDCFGGFLIVVVGLLWFF